MAFVYEINGQKVEFEKEPTEADIDEAAKSMGSTPASEGDVAKQAAQTIAPAGMLTGATGFDELGQVIKAGASPYMNASGEALKKTAQIYKAMPIVAPAIDVAGTALFGAPPIAMSQQAMGAYEKYGAIKEGAKAVSQQLSQGAPKELLNAAGELTVKPETMKTYSAMQNTLRGADPTFSKAITDAYGLKTGGGGNNAVRTLLTSAEGQAKMAANPAFAQAAQEYLRTVPTYGQQAMKVVSPFIKGALKVAGPAATALNVYDAGQLARETELGSRLQQGQGQQAEAAFRNLNTKYGNAMTPQQAQNVMDSGSQRDIEAFGGSDKLKQLIRQKAAQRVIGQ